MKIGKKYKLESDTNNITLYEKQTNKKTGGVYWTTLAYFATPKNALKFLADHKIREGGFTDLETITRQQDEIYSLINSLNIPEKP